MHFGLAWSSDILGILPNGQFLAIECKREKDERLSRSQSEFLNKINENCVFSICVNSLDDLVNIKNIVKNNAKYYFSIDK